MRQREPRPEPQGQLEVAEVEAEDIVEARPEVAGAVADRAAPRAGTRVHHKVKAGSLLAARAATEYVYVSQDLRRILLVASVLIGILFALWLLFVVFQVIPLPFY